LQEHPGFGILAGFIGGGTHTPMPMGHIHYISWKLVYYSVRDILFFGSTPIYKVILKRNLVKTIQLESMIRIF